MDDPQPQNESETRGSQTSGSERIAEVRRLLLDHYDDHRRDLPWRKDDDPYRIWVSEVMLQQTRVDTVVPYYRRWIERFPSLDDLAAADQEEVLQLWKGLGYYSRARHLHQAARMVRERHGGVVPDTVEGLQELPGVGEYTAGAVASIAFDRPEPAVDGNVRRVLSRLYDLADPGNGELRRRAASLVDPDRPGCFNQALMELGATVCTPSAPTCPTCPLGDFCLARARGTEEERPRPRKRRSMARKQVAVGIPVSPAGRTLLVRRPEDGLLGGLWEFPSLEVADGGDGEALEGGREPVDGESEAGGGDCEAAGSVRETADRARLARQAVEARGANPGADPPTRLGTLSHAFSHLKVTYDLYLFTGSSLHGDSAGARVVALDELDGVPLPVAQQKIGRRARKACREGPEQ